MRPAPWKVLAAAAAVCAAAGPVEARSKKSKDPAPAPPAVTEGTLETRVDGKVVDVPLEHTEVTIRASAHLATVEVEQVFRNPYDEKIEAVYLFPLPTGAAVNHMELEVDGRVIVGEIAEKQQAQATYVRARKEGHVAALLTQERPNLFTQNVANLEPGARVKVRLRYLEPLVYKDGGYELVFPMVAPPRYIPEASKQAGDKAAVQPSVLPAGLRPATDIGLRVELDAGVPIRALASPSHQLTTSADPAAPARASVRLAPGDTIPNKDFILRWQVAGDAPEFAVLAHRGDDGKGSFFLVMQPPRDAAPAQVTPREIVLVVDTSSSMRGAPLAKAKAVVRGLLGGLGPDDTFQIVRFADAASALGDRPLAASAKNREWALAWVDALEAGGGTEMVSGIGAALDFPHDPARLRLVVFITDGYVGNEDEILATVQQKLGASRLFSFGVGTAVNRYLLEEMAVFGRGEVQIVRPDEDTAAAVAKLGARLERPVLTDVKLAWEGVEVADLTPGAVPDLFVGTPIVLAGHYARGGTGTLVVRGMAAGRAVEYRVPVTLPERAEQPEVATVWARARIAELTRVEIRGATEATRAEILGLALAYHLVTRYTAFVAVDRAKVTAGGEARKVDVPVHVPEGLAIRDYGGGGGVGYGTIGTGSYAIGYGGGGGGYAAGGSMAYKMAVEEPALEAAPPPVTKSPKPVDPAPDVRASADASASSGGGDAPAQVAKKAPALRKAVDARLKDDPGAAGKYVLELVIAADGTVKKVTVKERPAGGAAMAEALAAEARTWKLAAPGEDVTIELPIVLQSK